MTKKMPTAVTSLSNFSGITATDNSPPIEPELPPTATEQPKKNPRKARSKVVTINIKISQSQKNWLANTATDIRANNDEPVPPNERVFPQHLICVAIDLLKSSEIDWNQIKSEQDLRQHLNL
ncbi:MAG: hypothetical protein VKL42_00835 [Snowella sp.]|nr:hypothetical protein [Snowella sp.]